MIYREHWRFKIKECEAYSIGPIYDIRNKELLKEDFELWDYYERGDLNPYLREDCWIFLSSCKVYDYEGFLPHWPSEDFHKSNEEYISTPAGIWVIEMKGNTYYMCRPDIPFVAQNG